MIIEPIKIEIKYPWSMMSLENAGEWIDMVKNSLESSDPLFGKDIFVSGRHEFKKLLLVENDTNDNYAIVSIENNSSSQGYTCTTVEILSSRRKLADKLQQDHEVALNRIAKHGET
jgi:hypothetical protein